METELCAACHDPQPERPGTRRTRARNLARLRATQGRPAFRPWGNGRWMHTATLPAAVRQRVVTRFDEASFTIGQSASVAYSVPQNRIYGFVQICFNTSRISEVEHAPRIR